MRNVSRRRNFVNREITSFRVVMVDFYGQIPFLAVFFSPVNKGYAIVSGDVLASLTDEIF